MKKKLLALALLAGGSLFAETRFSIGIHLGGPPAYYGPVAPAYVVGRPPCPGPDYIWTDGYWSQGWGHRTWINGSWARQRDFRRGRYNDRYGYQGRGYDRDHRDYDRGWTGGAYGSGYRYR